MGSLCTCFQGNRGLQNTGRSDFLFSMCCTALWQNTADPSNDSKKALIAAPPPSLCSARLRLKATRLACTSHNACRKLEVHGERRGNHRCGSMHGSYIRDDPRVTSPSVPPPPLPAEMIRSSGLQSVGRLPDLWEEGQENAFLCGRH